MKNKLKAISAIAAIAVGLTYYLHRSAFCMSEFRFLSQQELIDAAIKYEISPGHLSGALSWGSGREGEAVPIASVADFKAMYPTCCRIATGSDDYIDNTFFGFLDRLAGYHSATVRIEYGLNYIDKSGQSGVRPIVSSVFVTSCGQVNLGRILEAE